MEVGDHMYFFKCGSLLRVFQTPEEIKEMFRTQENFDHTLDYVYYVTYRWNVEKVEWVIDNN